MGQVLKLYRRIDAASAWILALLGRFSHLTVARILALFTGLAWLIVMVVIKIHLIDTGTLTSDIAYYQNMLYNTGWSVSKGSFYFLFSVHDVMAHGSYTFLNEHFSPTLALLSPVFRVFPYPWLLSVLQPGFLLVAAWGLFRLTQRLLDVNGAAPGFGLLPALVAATYLFNYSNVSATVDVMYGFHHDSLIPPLLVWAIVGVAEGRWRLALVLFVLFLGLKENLPIISASGLGFCLVTNCVVPRKKALIGLALCGAFFAGCYWMEFRTHNRHVGIIYRFFNPEIIDQVLDRPFKWPIVTNFWPGLLAPPFALPALADLCLQVVGDTTELDWHSYALMSFGMLATVWAFVKVLSLTKRWTVLPLTAYVALASLMAGPMIEQGVTSCTLIWRAAFQVPRLVDRAALAEVSAPVPRDAKLSTSSDLLVFFSDRHQLLWPESASLSEYVLVNHRDKQDNRFKAEGFARTAVGKDKANEYFYSNLDVILRGLDYDEVLYAYMDRKTAAGDAVILRSNGSLVLYKLLRGR